MFRSFSHVLLLQEKRYPSPEKISDTTEQTTFKQKNYEELNHKE